MITTNFPTRGGGKAVGRTIIINTDIGGGAGWYKVAEVTVVPAINEDRNIVFYVCDSFCSEANKNRVDGILSILIRIGNPENPTNNDSFRAEWLAVTDSAKLENFCLEIDESTKTVELWVYEGIYNNTQFTVLAEGNRFGSNKQYFTLYDKPAAGTKPTEKQGYKEVVSTVAKLKANAYSVADEESADTEMIE